MSTTVIDFTGLARREVELRGARPGLRRRDAAEALGVCEAALVEALRISEGGALSLRRPTSPEGFGELLKELPPLGRLMALTRNEHCVHEVYGAYAAPQLFGAMGMTLGAIDLRLFLSNWRFGYALTEQTERGPRRSLHFFDASGEAVHKIYATAETDLEAWEALVSRWTDPAPAAPEYVAPPPRRAGRPDAEVELEALRAGWAAMRDPHDFETLLKKHDVTRIQALALVGEDFARPVARESIRTVLEGAAAGEVPLMVFVGNRGCIQIHTGAPRTVKVMGPWLNILDPGFNLHLREDRVASAWVTRKPAGADHVHALELYDETGFCFARVFGERHGDEAERADWRALATGLAPAVGELA